MKNKNKFLRVVRILFKWKCYSRLCDIQIATEERENLAKGLLKILQKDTTLDQQVAIFLMFQEEFEDYLKKTNQEREKDLKSMSKYWKTR